MMHAYQRVLLLNPLHQGFLGMGFEPNISLGYLSETLTSKRVCHKVFDMALGYNQTNLWREIERFRPDLVGITMVSLDYMDTLRLIRKMKKRVSVTVVVGGPHVSCQRESLMERHLEIDYGVIMEGEQTFMELISGMAPSTIKGLLYRSGSRVVFTGQRPFIKNLDAIPFPTYEQFELKKYLKRSVGIVTSRGCPHQCIYCPVRLTSGGKMRLRSSENVFKEISFWYKRGYRTLDIWDDNFTIHRGRILDLCD